MAQRNPYEVLGVKPEASEDEVRAALALGDWSSAEDAKLLLPGSVSIARVIIESWAEAG